MTLSGRLSVAEFSYTVVTACAAKQYSFLFGERTHLPSMLLHLDLLHLNVIS